MINVFKKKSVINKIKNSSLSKFDYALKNPLYIQNKILKKILQDNKNTAYGRKYRFDKIKSIEEYQKNVPIIVYQDILSFIERTHCGEQNLLTSKKVEFMGTTSGSSGKPKLIPITKLRAKQATNDALLVIRYNLLKKNRLGVGKNLYLVGGEPYNIPKNKIPHATASKYILENAPYLFKKSIAYPINTLDIEDYDKKMHVIMKYAIMEKNITSLSFPYPLEAMFMFDYVKKNRQNLIAEISADGYKKQAKRLEHLPDFEPSTLWPKLKYVMFIWTPETDFYFNKLQKKIRKKLIAIDPGIYSTEGRLTLNITKYKTAGVMMPNTNFFEFQEQAKDGFKQPVTMDKLKKGKRYRIIMTTPEGLYRYNIKDILEVVDFKGKLPIVKFYGREKYFGLLDEKLPELEVVSLCNKALESTKINLKTYLLTVNSDNSSYDLLIEKEKDALTKSEAEKLSSAIDSSLKKFPAYSSLRKKGKLKKPAISDLEQGEYERFYMNKIKTLGETKAISCSSNPEIKKRFNIRKVFK